MEPDALVRRLYQSFQDRDWLLAADLLHPEATLDLPATAERLEGRETILAFENSYPEPWGVLTLRRVLTDDFGAAVEADVIDPDGQRFSFAGIWRMRDGLLHQGVEYWVSVGAEGPPQHRLRSPMTELARKTWDAAYGADH
jgi:ketosteroid isomerase-like protein